MAKKMSELKTEELTAELKLTKDIEDYLDFDELAPVSLAEYINALVENKKTKLSIVARKAHISSAKENVNHLHETKPCRFVSDLDWI